MVDTTEVVAAIIGGTGLVGTAWTASSAFRAARRTARDTREIETDKLTAASWAEQVKGWRQDVITLRQQRAEDLASFEERLAAKDAELDAAHDMIRRRDDLIAAFKQQQKES